ITHSLDYLPLALTQAAACIRMNEITVAQYLGQLNASEEDFTDLLNVELQDLRRDFDSSQSVIRTWRLSFDRIRDKDPHAADLMARMALLDRNAIPEDILHKPKERRAVFTTALGTLLAYDLVSFQKASNCYSIHRLVQRVMRWWLDASSLADKTTREVTHALCQAFPKLYPDKWAICELLLPHIESLQTAMQCRGSGSSTADTSHLLGLMVKAASYENERGRYGLAEQRLLSAKTQILNVPESSTAAALRLEIFYHLSKSIYGLGRFRAAEEILRGVSEEQEALLGGDHPSTLATLHHLGSVCHSLGQYEEALAIFRGILDIRESLSHVDENNNSSNNRNNGKEVTETQIQVARVLLALGKFDESEEMARAAHQQSLVLLGELDVLTLQCLDILASTLRRNGKYDESKVGSQQAFEERAEVLGPTHPDTLYSLNKLAIVTKYVGDLEEAERLFRLALESLGPDALATNPKALSVMNGLIGVLRDQTKYEGALHLAMQLLQRRRQVLPDGHVSITTSVQGVAKMLQLWGKFNEAEPYALEAVALRQELHGAAHPDTLIARTIYVQVLLGKGELAEAEITLTDVIAKSKSLLRTNHPTILTRTGLLAKVLAAQGRYSEAISLAEGVLVSLEKNKSKTKIAEELKNLAKFGGGAIMTRSAFRALI
ncbi:hypothetical protein B0T24DRAFT_540430, partial [Lasiosphaeria ovina]